ncbi:MAG TPA: hypothetical protein VMW76_07880 [Bacteroidales bacterium]|nr:hypothetical protein [Bacteroidales bacterium]
MIKRLLSIVVVTTVLTACGNSGSNQAKSSDATDSGATVRVEFASLIKTPDDFLNKEISIEGKVVHVCQHTGKKMFIVGSDPDIRLFISAGEEVPLFEQELLGSEIVVEGFLTKAEAGEMQMGMGEAKGEHEGVAEGGEMSGEACETEAAVEAQPVLADFVLQYRSHKVK